MKNAMPDSPLLKNLKNLILKNKFLKILNQLFCYSSKTCKIGETWNAAFVSKNNDIDISNNMTCKLEAVEGDVYKISYTGDLFKKKVQLWRKKE